MIRGEIRQPNARTLPAEPAAAQGDGGSGMLYRVGLWGGAAAACLLAVALATQTESGQGRLSSAFGTGQIAARQPAPSDAEVEARRTADTIRRLTEDRDRMLARMTALERNYEDVTGSIGRLATAPRPPAETAPAPPSPAPVVEAPVAVSPPPATPATSPGPPAPVSGTPPPVPAPVASAPASPEPADATPAKAEFGVDIGGGPTLASLRAAWDRIRRNHATMLEGLRPVISVRDRTGGQVELRLIVGPIANAATASRLCASLASAGLSCQPTMFEGQRLALR
jgi:hypothetical protein